MLLAAAMTAAAGSSGQPRQSVGLVLSGGGAKGIAHIGVIQALEDNDIPIDYITGTSMGAIVGGLYAAGYTPQEMMDMLLSPQFGYWSTGRIDPSLTYYFNREPSSPAMFSMPLKKKGSTDSVPQSLISGLPMSFAFMDMFSAYTAQCGGDFDRLFVPYRSVASNVAGKHKHVFRSGRLSDAIRCSMTFPIVFQPIAVNDTLLYDGGIYDNFPVDVMREDFAPSIMIGVNVSSSASKGPQTSFMDQLDALIIQGKLCELPPDEGIYMRVMLDEFALLDFPKARDIYKIGYERAMEMMDTIKERITSRTPAEVRDQRRRVFKSQSPYLRFDEVNVTGGTPRQNEYIKYLFSPPAHCDTIGIERARRAFYRAVSSGKIADLFPQAQYNDSSGLFTLDLKASVKGRYKGSLGGYITSSTSSFLYASVSYSSLSFSSVDIALSGWIGQTTMAGVLDGKLYLHTPFPSALGVQAVASRNKYYENDHIFYNDKYPTFLRSHEYFGRLKWSFAAGSTGAVDVGVGFGELRDSYFNDNSLSSYEEGRSLSKSKLWQAFVKYRSSTLDAEIFPRTGYSMEATAMAVAGTNALSHTPGPEVRTDVKWLQLEFSGRRYINLSTKMALGLETDVMLSTRKLLPSFGAAISGAPAFCPTPASNNAFRADFRANSYAAVGLVPVYNIMSNLAARVSLYGFMPLRRIEEGYGGSAVYGRWLRNPEAFCEADIEYHFPFGTLAGYVNYSTIEGSRWNVGLAFGVYILPPKFLR